ncbi:M56 family metallopeptidase [Sphingobacterium haloxyli]|uniref:Peptidase M56 domain-containing protein n=1 Tax=Sphingobacterium haloxyli TaxID=2100533 RepID=A0A2S9J0G5_9SPHI|nr:M56 family metallopeptidase [Sphingobacterium haloxyli]PRD46238.1 hypothetical protein C5745_16680 [Sphingobacterium haloxyli]
MYSLLAYIIQVNILLAVVYIGYSVLLKRLTFYRLNRGYFLVGGFFSFAYPFLDIKSLFRDHIEPVGELMAYLPGFYMRQVEESVYTLENAIYSGIAVVGLWFVTRLCIQLLSLLRIHLHSRKAIWKTYWYQHVLFPIVPFSFLNKIYLHKEQHQESELYGIFEHENIHVKGLHSIDILMFEILLILCWYNPFVWFMRRAVRQNLEYLTDQQVLNKGVDRKTYQYSLLNVSKQGASLGVSSQFNFKFLKKRIMMMNKKKSSKLELSKYAFLLPIFIFSAGAFTISKADVKITEAAEVVREKRLDSFKAEEKNERYDHDQESLEGVVVGPDMTKSEQEALSSKESKLDVKGLQREPLYIVDGKQMLSGFDLDALNPDDIESVSVWKNSAEAIVKYGNEAAHGVVEITTIAKARQDAVRKKEQSQKEMTDTLSGTVGDNDRTTSAEVVNSIGHFRVQGVKKNPLDTTKQPLLLSRGLKSGTVPLYVIDDEVQSKGKTALDALDPNEIESITVLKDKSAISVYGDKGKNGVLVIATKSGGNTQGDAPVITVKGYRDPDSKAVTVDTMGATADANRRGRRVWGFVAPKPLKNPAYMVDGELVSKKVYAKIKEEDKTSIVTLTEEQAKDYLKAHNKKGSLSEHDGLVKVTTR